MNWANKMNKNSGKVMMHLHGNKLGRLIRGGLAITAFALAAQSSLAGPSAVPSTATRVAAQILPAHPAVAKGQSVTQLGDGRWLLLGGDGRNKIVDMRTGAATALADNLFQGRMGHTATLLPDGSIIVLGGTDADGNVINSAELFDPASASVTSLGQQALIARTGHSATVLTDGRLFIAGGVDARGNSVPEAELYNPLTRQSEQFNQRLDAERSAHLAALLPSSKVLMWGGVDARNQARQDGELFDYEDSAVRAVLPNQAEQLAATLGAPGQPSVVDSLPAADTTGFNVDDRLVVRFSKRMAVASLNTETVTLIGPTGVISVKPVPVENGVLLFVTPRQQLLPASRYTLFIKGAKDEAGNALPFTAIGFGTAQIGVKTPAQDMIVGQPLTGSGAKDTASQPPQASGTAATVPALAAGKGAPGKGVGGADDDDEWHPEPAKHFHGQWTTGHQVSKMQALPPLAAGPGETALAGQTMTLRGRAISKVSLKIDGHEAETDETGRFLVTGLTAGKHVLTIDGNHTGRGARYGHYETQVDIKAGTTNVLDFTIWLSKLDKAGDLKIPSPTTKETVLTTPRIPGLELRLPAGSVIRDRDGKIVTELNMTAIPTDRPPFPIPGVGVPVYFTVQPGGAIIQNVKGEKLQGARLIYPNFAHAAAGARIDFWNYDARSKGWYVYGKGTVTPDEKQVVPDPGVAIYEFSGAMISNPSNAPDVAPPCGPDVACGGDPVDLYTGLFFRENTDLVVDDVVPLEIRRVYRSHDYASRAFGTGSNLSYDIFLVGQISPWSSVDLILPNGGKVHYPRTSSGTGYSDAVYTAPVRGTKYDGSTISHTGSSSCYWKLQFKDGASMCFPESMNSTNARAAAVTSMTDRFGNTITMERNGNHDLRRVTSPNGRWIEFTYDTSRRITDAVDNAGRTLKYEYDANGRLIKATMPDSTFEVYTYTASAKSNMATVQDQRGHTMVTNIYGTYTCQGTDGQVSSNCGDGPVTKQTYADGKTNLFRYMTSSSRTTGLLVGNPLSLNGEPVNGGVAATEVTDERGIVKRVEFDVNGLPTNVIEAFGLPEQRTTTTERDANSLVLSRTDGLGRKTKFDYDSMGNVLSKTYLAGTANEVKVTMTYTPDNLLETITDALLHKTTMTYDLQGNLVDIKDANGNHVQFAYEGQGRRSKITNGEGKSWTLNYIGADLVSMVDPLNNMVTRYADNAGRTQAITDPLGNESQLFYNKASRVSQSTDPLGNSTSMLYDQNGNLAQVTDAKSNVHEFGFDDRDYANKYVDPLTKAESVLYDGNHNLTQRTDRKGQITTYTYDNLNRLKQIRYQDGSTVTYTLDAANRIRKIVDSLNGTIDYTYDDFDRVTSSATAKGTVSYTYYANGLRKTMTVSGQPALRYTYDDGNRLTRIDQDAAPSNNNVAQSVRFVYDKANRRTQTTLPNGMTVNYGFDDAGRLTSIIYKNPQGTQIGDLNYRYDAAGRRMGMGGTFARVSLPDSTAVDALVDKANRLTSWNGQTLTYDDNGNLTNDGTNNYMWNARDQLVQIKDGSGQVTATFSYDALGRRQSKTVNGTSTGYVYDGLNIVQELSGTAVDNSLPANVRANYINGAVDEVFAQLSGTGTDAKIMSYLTDALGSTIRLANSLGNKVVDYTYDTYGNTTADAVVNNPFQYTGRENDGNGLYFYRARYYAPGYARFISSDPLGLDAGINTYAYVGGNPLSYKDPLGLNPAAGALTGAEIGSFAGPVGTVIGGLIGAGVGWWIADKIGNAIFNEGKDGPSVPIDLPDKIPDFDFDKPDQCPVDNKGNTWPWKGKPPQGGDKGGYKNPNGPESIHPDLGHGGDIGPHWDFNDRNGPGYRIYPDGTIRPK
jgi:RHS repeat-associated protein